MILLGTALLMLPGVGSHRWLSFLEAMFTATSALSVTGLSVIIPSQDLTLFGQIILLVLIQLGGVGFMVVAVVVFRMLGRRVSLMDRLALSDSLGLLEPRAIMTLTRRVLTMVLLTEAVGALLLWYHWRSMLGDSRALFYAIFHAVSAFCNAGFDLFSGTQDIHGIPFTGIPNDTISLLVLGGLIFLGGLGIPVLADIFTWPQSRRLTLHTRITLVVIVSLICVGGVGIWFAETRSHGLLTHETMPRQFVLAFFQSISARTAGFASIPSFASISPASQQVLMMLMFIGAAPASMGGGITTGTFAVLVIAVWSYARRRPSPRIGNRSIAKEMIHKALAVLTISLTLVMLATWLLLVTHPVGFHVALFEVISAFATCGLSLDFTTDLNPFGEVIIMFIMFWGRLGALTIVIALAQPQAPQLVEYPEEKILIG